MARRQPWHCQKCEQIPLCNAMEIAVVYKKDTMYT